MIDSKKIIVSLDGMSEKEALKIAGKLCGHVWGFKVNDILYGNINIIRELKKFGKVFVDVKLHDIPNTVSNSVKRISKLGADIITVHASGGMDMMKSAKKNAGKCKIIAVTVLTSSSLKSTNDVMELVQHAIKARVDGIVCSGQELESVKKLHGAKSLIKIVPGIRPKWYKTKDDQKRTMTPNEALEFGADYLVIGRPLTKSKNILKTLQDM